MQRNACFIDINFVLIQFVNIFQYGLGELSEHVVSYTQLSLLLLLLLLLILIIIKLGQ